MKEIESNLSLYYRAMIFLHLCVTPRFSGHNPEIVL